MKFLFILFFPAFVFAQNSEVVVPGTASGGLQLRNSRTSQATPYLEEVRCISAFQTSTMNDLPNTIAAGETSGDETFAITDTRDGQKGIYALKKEGVKFYPMPGSPFYSDQNVKVYGLQIEKSECQDLIPKMKWKYKYSGVSIDNKPCGFSFGDGWWAAGPGYPGHISPEHNSPKGPYFGVLPPAVKGKDVNDKKTRELLTSLIKNKLLTLPENIRRGEKELESFKGKPEEAKWRADAVKRLKDDIADVFCGCRSIMEKEKMANLRNLPEVLKWLPKNTSLKCDLLAQL